MNPLFPFSFELGRLKGAKRFKLGRVLAMLPQDYHKVPESWGWSNLE